MNVSIVRTALLALIGFMPTQGEGAIGSLDYTSEERKALARRSLAYSCPTCKIDNATVLPMLTDKSSSERAEAKELASQIQFKNSKPNDAANTNREADNSENTSAQTSSATVSSSDSGSSSTTTTAETVLTRRTTSTTTVTSEAQSERAPASTRPQQQQFQLQRQRPNDSNNLSQFVMSILLILFIFLAIRRIYLIVDSYSFPI